MSVSGLKTKLPWLLAGAPILAAIYVGCGGSTGYNSFSLSDGGNGVSSGSPGSSSGTSSGNSSSGSGTSSGGGGDDSTGDDGATSNAGD